MARGEMGDALSDRAIDLDDTLEAGDVLMEVLAEDHRNARARVLIEYSVDDDDDDQQRSAADNEQPLLPKPKGPGVAQRQYLTHPGVGHGTAYQRQQAAARAGLAAAESHAFDYRLPTEAKAQREHEKRSRARMRDHDVIENRIQEAMDSGAFDDLPGYGKPLPVRDNVFEDISGEGMANRVLKNAGVLPGWIEKGKNVRQSMVNARAHLAMEWAACVPEAAVAAAAEAGGRVREWLAATAAFEVEIGEINRQIASYNMAVPAPWMQMPFFKADRELQRALQQAPQRAAELKATRRGRLADAARARHHEDGERRAGGRGGGASSFAPGAPGLWSGMTFALNERPAVPSVFDALQAALFAAR